MSSRLPGILPALMALVLFAGGGFMSVPAFAETAYVTDSLQLDLYASANMSGNAIRKLRSGDAFEVLERQARVARVRLPDGQTGWVKSLYIVNQEPARTRVNALEDANAKLEAQVSDLREQLGNSTARIAELEGGQDGVEEQRAAIADELTRLRLENRELEDVVATYGSSVPLSWLIVATLLALGLGAFAGWYWIDSRSRARHGGYRVY